MIYITKRFKPKKRHYFSKFFILLSIICFSFIYTFKFFSKKINTIEIDSDKYLKYLLKTGFNNQIDNFTYFNFFSPTNLLSKSLNTKVVISNNDLVEEVIEEVEEESITEPVVYIYNTHQTEEYKSHTLQDYNIKPTVLIASYLLEERLNDYGVKTLLETASIKDILTNNNWNYAHSYDASRSLLENAIIAHPSLKFFIDFHRDSSVYEKTTLTIDNKNYAKILFIVGKEHDNYLENLEVASKLNEKIKELNPELSRGIYQKYGPGVNGIYNQDFNRNTILMEVGGQYNTIEEVSNTINLISEVLANFIKESI